MSTGTYVGLRVLPHSAKKLKQYCVDNGIAITTAQWERRLHTTLIYSRINLPTFVADPKKSFSATFDGFDLFDGQNPGENPLVVRLSSPLLLARHKFIRQEFGATHDYPSYEPHVTLTYNFTGNISELQPIDFNISLGLEYSEDIKHFT